jgi:superfamily II DNA or RNA helicase
MTLSEWQIALRRQVSRQEPLTLRNQGSDPVFSEFAVTNPRSERSYRVVIRGEAPGQNYCSCPDYAINTLGTCKHVEFVLGRLRRRHASRLRRGWRPPYSEVFVHYGDRRRLVFSAAADCPRQVRTAARRCFDARGELETDRVERFDGLLTIAHRGGHDLRVYDDAIEYVAERRDDRKRRRKLQRLYGGPAAERAWRNLLKLNLYPYQREGALFAAVAGRAILADEMGLGKTVQALATAEMLALHCGVERVLIVCPASLKYQWMSEIDRFSNRPARVVEGQTHVRRAAYLEPGFFKIVNYDVIHRDLEAIALCRPDLVILDEAQRIKNWQTRTAKSVKQVSSRYSLILTGTPLENRLEELHSIVEFVDRHRLGPLFAFKATHEVRQEDSTRVIGYEHLDQVAKTLEPILMRRRLSEVLKQLPPRIEKNYFVPMTPQQWAPHDENREIVARLVQKWQRHKFLSEADQLRLRIALQNMRMVCDSTYLLDKQSRHGMKVEELRRLLEEVFEDRTSKVVIFSQWLRMNELVTEMLEDARWGYVHLHGGVPSPRRAELTRALREEPDCRVFLSTDAGGVGLNLQAASAVINMDLPWNPAVLDQRIGRVHRLGQKRPVRVVNFIAEHTIEHGMLSLLAFKKSVFAGVLDGATDRVFMGESAMNRFIRTVEKATGEIPERPATGEDANPPSVGAQAEFLDSGITVGGQDEPGQERFRLDSTAPAALPVSTEALSVLLDRGAKLLREFSRSLGTVGQNPAGKANNGQPISIVRDEISGRPEVRLTLPDEKSLADWVGRLGRLIGNLQRPS